MPASHYRLLSYARVCIALIVVASIWVPIVLHYHVAILAPTFDQVRALRTVPSNDALENPTISEQLIPRPAATDNEIIASAERYRVALAEGNSSLEAGLQTLEYASLAAPDALVRAFEVSSNAEYLAAAASFLLAFSRYERNQWMPKGFLWNDHAIAERIGVLIRFWRAYRGHFSFDESVAQEVLWHAFRCAEFLSRPDHFTIATNHGVMQNIALLQAVLAFPSMQRAEDYRSIAYHRLDRQLEFFVNSEGVVLEHSAGYHAIGTHMLDLATRLLTLNELPVPETWRLKLSRAKEFNALISRPDGTLPAFGDTDFAATQLEMPAQSPDTSKGDWFALYPTAGYAIWGSGDDLRNSTHTVTVWSNFPDLGHKHADEMSLLVWARGETWITNSGYWPYADARRSDAEGWLGSNAPHWVGETQELTRDTTLEASAHSADATAVVLRRSSQDGRSISRQIVNALDRIWITVDSGDAAGEWQDARLELIWTVPPDVTLLRSGPGHFVLSRHPSDIESQLAVFGAEELNVHHGDVSPFAGWIVVRGRPTPTHAVRVQAPKGTSHLQTVLIVDQPAAESRVAFDFKDRDVWSATGLLEGWPWQVSRNGSTIRVSRQKVMQTVHLSPAPDPAVQRGRIALTIAEATKEYPRHKDLAFYRKRLTYVLLMGLIVQETIFAVLRRSTKLRGIGVSAQGLALLAWLLGAAWVHTTYLT